jgi:hypothetical protein
VLECHAAAEQAVQVLERRVVHGSKKSPDSGWADSWLLAATAGPQREFAMVEPGLVPEKLAETALHTN